MAPWRVYVDTSVFGGCFDREFTWASLRFFHEVKRGKVHILLNDVVLDELARAPTPVRNILYALPEHCWSQVEMTRDVIMLRDAYLKERIVSHKYRGDATHVATATVHRADAIVSWNFRHIVKLDKIKAYHRVNWDHGYGIITILSPREVLSEKR